MIKQPSEIFKNHEDFSKILELINSDEEENKLVGCGILLNYSNDEIFQFIIYAAYVVQYSWIQLPLFSAGHFREMLLPNDCIICYDFEYSEGALDEIKISFQAGVGFIDIQEMDIIANGILIDSPPTIWSFADKNMYKTFFKLAFTGDNILLVKLYENT